MTQSQFDIISQFMALLDVKSVRLHAAMRYHDLDAAVDILQSCAMPLTGLSDAARLALTRIDEKGSAIETT